MERRNQDIKVRDARPVDAAIVAEAVMMALHEANLLHLAGSEENLPKLRRLFTELAAREDSQYSYLNSLIAEDSDGRIAGAIVAYDGARLHQLREAFVELGNELFGWNMSETDMDNETEPGEIYLDSLAVFDEFRGRGVASLLINSAIERHREGGKPFGLLCDPANPGARVIYEHLGFKDMGERLFAGIPMRHMQKD